MKQLSFHPQVSPNWNKNEKFECSHYIETVDIVKIIKMGSLHAFQKWSLTRKKIFFVVNHQNIGCKPLPKEEKNWNFETWPFTHYQTGSGILKHCELLLIFFSPSINHLFRYYDNCYEYYDFQSYFLCQKFEFL